MSEEQKTRNPWPGYPRRFALGVGRIVEVSFEDAPKDRESGPPYVVAIDADHESVELPVDVAAPEGYLTVKERDLVDALGDVLQLGRRATFAVDVRGAVDALRGLQRGIAAWARDDGSVDLSTESVADLLNGIGSALRALGEVPRE